MKISTVRIQNFRSIEDETISLNDYTCLVGPNGAGKSNVLTALNIFFRETANATTNLTELSDEDFHNKNTAAPVIITVTFGELNDQAKQDLSAYVRQDRLVVSAVATWDGTTKSAIVKQYGQRLGIEAFRIYFEKDKEGAKVPELKTQYASIRESFPELPAVSVKAEMVAALHEYEAQHSERCALIPSEDQFYGVSKGANRLDPHIQWVYVPAVKDATTEQVEGKNTAFGRLLARRVHSQMGIKDTITDLKRETLSRYDGILSQNMDSLSQLSDSLSTRFQQWAHQDARVRLDWQRGDGVVNIAQPTAEVNATEGRFEGKLARFGHGLQRSFIFALLQELSEHAVDTGPKLILGIEEPELYQHPPQERYLAALLQRLSSQNSQVLVCTHSPSFVNGNFGNVRMVTKKGETQCSVIAEVTPDRLVDELAAVTGEATQTPSGVVAQVEQDMLGPMSEMFFAAVRVFVEGVSDMAYITSYLSLMGLGNEFRRLGCHLIPVNGKGRLLYAVAISNHLDLPYFVMFDADGDTPADTAGKTTGRRQQHERENGALFNLMSESSKPFPADHYWGARAVAWRNNIEDVIVSEIPDFSAIQQTVRTKYGILAGNMEKNHLFVGYVLAEAWEAGKKSPSLIRLCESIIEFANSQAGAAGVPLEADAEAVRPQAAQQGT